MRNSTKTILFLSYCDSRSSIQSSLRLVKLNPITYVISVKIVIFLSMIGIFLFVAGKKSIMARTFSSYAVSQSNILLFNLSKDL